MQPETTLPPIDLRRRVLVGTAVLGLVGCGGGKGGTETSAENGVGKPPTEPPASGSAPPPAAAPAPNPPPSSPPAPPSPTPPPPPPVSFDARITFQQMALSQTVLFESFHEGSRYERFRRLQVLSGDRAQLRFKGFDFATGGTLRVLSGTRYSLLVDGETKAFVHVPANTTTAQFDVDLTQISPGWRRIEVGGLAGGETSPGWWVFVQRGSVGEQAFTPVVMSTFELIRRADSSHGFAIAPGKYRPAAKPLVRRDYTPFDTALPKAELNCTQLVPLRESDIHRPNLDPAGILSAFDRQSYFWSDVFAAEPRVALLDGPRGVGTFGMATHVEIGRGPRGNVFACDPWRMVRIGADGSITTLVGKRHRGPASHYEGPQNLELVGDWSSVPIDRRGFHELWGFAWDERTLAINAAAAPIPSENNEQPHVVGPTVFLADTQNDRIVRVEFSATAHNLPARVTEFITGVADPWDIVFREGLLYVAERKAHRISAWDASTGAFVRTVVQGAALATVARDRISYLTTSLADARGEKCVAPEGLYLLDDWLYFGSRAQAQVRRVHLRTAELQVVCPVDVDGNTNFVKIALSDGSFGPRGTVFMWTWSSKNFGFPQTILPDGSPWPWYHEDHVGAGQWGAFAYPSAGAVGGGRLVTGGVNEGLLVVAKRSTSDTVASDAVRRGALEYKRRGLHLLFGEHGFGFFSLAQPFGYSADIDAYLSFHGHQRGFA
jgi:hypothetical protein